MDCSAARAKSFLYGGKAACPFKKHEKGAAGSAIWFPKITSLNKQAIAYLKSRNINDGLIRHFQLAFCDTDTAYNDKIYYTSNRLIIPVKDLNGKIISWQGRDITGKSFAKYLFPPGFKGAEYVYNIDAIEPESYIIICEGVFDVFGWWQAGFKNTVATFGKKISKHQLALIKSKRPKVIYIAWDSDANWQKYDFCEKLTDFCPVKIIDLNNKDADELSPAELLRAFKTARPNDWSAKIFSLLAV
jgi:DNA primase